jgi:hypothetical protein
LGLENVGVGPSPDRGGNGSVVAAGVKKTWSRESLVRYAEPAVEVVGFALIVAFFWFWWWPLAFLVAGILCVLWANRPLLARRSGE